DRRTRRDFRRPFADGLAADRFGDVAGIGEHRLRAVGTRLETDRNTRGELAEPTIVVGRDPALAGDEPDDPIHRTGVDVHVAEAPGERTGDGTLPGSGGTVDRDDQTLRPHPNEFTQPDAETPNVRRSSERSSRRSADS